jgi:7-carboxy-7-deazaguanine synthase
MSVHDIVRAVEQWNVEHVVITGGEPMLWSETLPLTRQLQDRGHHITIETAGTLYLPVHCDLMSISPKMSNSRPHGPQHLRWQQRHERTRTAPEVIRRLVRQYAYQFKFVVDDPSDLKEIDEYLRTFAEIDSDCVMLMPQGTTQDALDAIQAWLEPLCQQRGQRFCPRKQVEWFGLVRGT